jgi:N-acetyl-gamma-glutamyl-phosphate reductase
MSKLVEVAIVGASGYSGEELIRLVLRHPNARLTVITSRQYEGRKLLDVFPQFSAFPVASELVFVKPDVHLIARHAKFAFMALPHGVSASMVPDLLSHGVRIADLSADFRLRDADVYKEFYGADHPCPQLLSKAVYGLPEIYREEIKTAELIACPGCYPTSILLPLIPLLKEKKINPTKIIVNSMSGVTGAGRKVELQYLFSECNESLRAYGFPKHRHLSEIEQELSKAAEQRVIIEFIPHLVPVNRGILTTICTDITDTFENKQNCNPGEVAVKSWQAFYANEPFIRVYQGNYLPDTKNVVGTNVIEFGCRFDPRTNRLIIVSTIDNIVKGAAGQAIQCFNIVNNFDERCGLV